MTKLCPWNLTNIKTNNSSVDTTSVFKPASRASVTLCCDYNQYGCCNHGEFCDLAHHISLLGLHDFINPVYQTVPCTHFTVFGTCPRGENCRFEHKGESLSLEATPTTSRFSVPSFNGCSTPSTIEDMHSETILPQIGAKVGVITTPVQTNTEWSCIVKRAKEKTSNPETINLKNDFDHTDDNFKLNNAEIVSVFKYSKEFPSLSVTTVSTDKINKGSLKPRIKLTTPKASNNKLHYRVAEDVCSTMLKVSSAKPKSTKTLETCNRPFRECCKLYQQFGTCLAGKLCRYAHYERDHFSSLSPSYNNAPSPTNEVTSKSNFDFNYQYKNFKQSSPAISSRSVACSRSSSFSTLPSTGSKNYSGPPVNKQYPSVEVAFGDRFRKWLNEPYYKPTRTTNGSYDPFFY